MSPEGVINIFQRFQDNFEKDQETYRTIHETTVKLEQIVRKMMTALQRIHLEAGLKDYYSILSSAKTYIPKCAEIYQELSTYVPEKAYYKYHDQWKHTTQRAVFCVALIQYLETSELASRENVAVSLSLMNTQSEGFHLDLDDYLHGILQLVSELSRFAINSAAAGDYERPLSISQFVNELSAGFRLINFKNDALRKHYDSFKYDLKKIEEVVYDLSIRGLKSSVNESGSANKDKSSSAAEQTQ